MPGSMKRSWDIVKDKVFAPLATGLANIFLGASTLSVHLSITFFGNIDNFRNQFNNIQKAVAEHAVIKDYMRQKKTGNSYEPKHEFGMPKRTLTFAGYLFLAFTPTIIFWGIYIKDSMEKGDGDNMPKPTPWINAGLFISAFCPAFIASMLSVRNEWIKNKEDIQLYKTVVDHENGLRIVEHPKRICFHEGDRRKEAVKREELVALLENPSHTDKEREVLGKILRNIDIFSADVLLRETADKIMSIVPEQLREGIPYCHYNSIFSTLEILTKDIITVQEAIDKIADAIIIHDYNPSVSDRLNIKTILEKMAATLGIRWSGEEVNTNLLRL
jgi:hypothetical protein